jgi:hypothetical protein
MILTSACVTTSLFIKLCANHEHRLSQNTPGKLIKVTGKAAIAHASTIFLSADIVLLLSRFLRIMSSARADIVLKIMN